MRPLLFGLLVCVSFLCVPVWAQQSSVANTPVQPILQKSLASLVGGATMTDVTLTGTARRIAGSDDEFGSATAEATSAGDSRLELSFASGNRVEIRNHSAIPLPGALPPGVPASEAQTPQPVGEWIGPDGAPHAMTSHNIMTDATWFFPALTLSNVLTSQNCVLSYVGLETRDGQSVVHVSAFQQLPNVVGNSGLSAAPANLPSHLTQMDFYLDPNSSFPVAIDFNQHPDNNALIDIPTEIRFSGYQAVNGVVVPMRVQKFLNNTLLLDLQFTKVTLNSGLSTPAFALR
jgi:hypothetical protein